MHFWGIHSARRCTHLVKEHAVPGNAPEFCTQPSFLPEGIKTHVRPSEQGARIDSSHTFADTIIPHALFLVLLTCNNSHEGCHTTWMSCSLALGQRPFY